MAVIQDTSVSNNSRINSGTSVSTITLTNFSVSSVSNRLTLLRIYTYSNSTSPATITGITYPGGTFTLISSKTVSTTLNKSFNISVWGIIAATPTTNGSIVITASKSCDAIVGYAETWSGVYQGALPINFYSKFTGINTATLAVTHYDADPIGALINVNYNFATSSTLTSGSGFSTDSSSSINGALVEFNHLLAPVVPQTDSWTVVNSSTSVAGLLSVELKPSNWQPAIPLPYTSYCAYFKGGQVRKMVNNVTGLTHLEGQTVEVVADGILPSPTQYTVTGGTLVPALTNKAGVIHVGLPYTGKLKFLPLGGDAQTVNETKDRKVYSVVFRLFESLGGKFGKDEDSLFTLAYDGTEDPLFTGDFHDVPFESSVDNLWEPVLVCDTPLPFMLLAAVIRSELFEDK